MLNYSRCLYLARGKFSKLVNLFWSLMVGMGDCRGVRGWAETTGAPLIGKSEWKDVNVLNKYMGDGTVFLQE